MFVIESNLRAPSGHYAEIARALGIRGGGDGMEVFAHPPADDVLAAKHRVRICKAKPRIGRPFAEWRAIFRAVATEIPFPVLSADDRNAAVLAKERDPRRLLEIQVKGAAPS